MIRIKAVLVSAVSALAMFASGSVNAQTWTVTDDWGSSAKEVAGDFNGDGRMDIASPDGGTVHMKLSTGSGFVSTSWAASNNWGGAAGMWTFAGDFNGDGLDDIASVSGLNRAHVYMKLSTGGGFTSTTWTVTNSWGMGYYNFAGDFNGDGLTDLASRTGNTVYMKLSTGSGFTSTAWTISGSYNSTARWNFAGDFNGDGRADLASVDGSMVYMKLSTGAGFTSANWSVSNNWGSGYYTFATDLNGDGRVDLVSMNNGTAYMKHSTGSGFTSSSDGVIDLWGGAEFTFAGDFTGDGYADVASADHSNVYMKVGNASGFTYVYAPMITITVLQAVGTWGNPDYYDLGWQSVITNPNGCRVDAADEVWVDGFSTILDGHDLYDLPATTTVQIHPRYPNTTKVYYDIICTGPGGTSSLGGQLVF